MERIALIGSNELSKQLAHCFESTGFGNVCGMFDDFESVGTTKHGKPILGKIVDAPILFRQSAFDSLVIAVGYKHCGFRKEVFEHMKSQQVPLSTFIHPTSYIDKTAVINEGTIVMAHCTIGMNAHLGENTFLYPQCLIAHDAKTGPHTFCGPRVTLAGNVEVGECCFLGVSTTVVDRVKIGMNVQTAAGAVITKDMPSHVLLAGIPAVVIKELDSGKTIG